MKNQQEFPQQETTLFVIKEIQNSKLQNPPFFDIYNETPLHLPEKAFITYVYIRP